MIHQSPGLVPAGGTLMMTDLPSPTLAVKALQESLRVAESSLRDAPSSHPRVLFKALQRVLELQDALRALSVVNPRSIELLEAFAATLTGTRSHYRCQQELWGVARVAQQQAKILRGVVP